MLDFLRDGKEITDFKNEQEKKLYFAELEYWCIKSEWKTIQELQKVFGEEPSEAHPKEGQQGSQSRGRNRLHIRPAR